MADLNGDQKPDLIVANQESHDVTILLGDGKGGFAPAKGSPFPAGRNPSDIGIDDVNGDGRLDLVFPNHDTTYVTLLLGDGQGGFAPATNSPLTVKSDPHPHTVAVGDLNGDRQPDLVVDDWQNNKLTVVFGRGRGQFATSSVSLEVPPIPYHNVRVADVNGDGHLDIVTPAMRQDAVTVLLGDGQGRFKPAAGSPFATGDAPFFVAIGDVNGDRQPDLAIAKYSGSIRDRSADGIAVLLGDGTGGFKPAAGSPFRAGHAPVRVALGDINGDGILDIAAANLGSDDVTVLLGGRKGIAAAPGSPYAAGRAPYAVAIGDVTGDGKADLVVANHRSNDLTVLVGK